MLRLGAGVGAVARGGRGVHAAEAVAATEGLGYRIFLVRRYMSMDVILPYVAWITLLAFLIDISLRLLNRKLYPWHE